MENNYVPVPGDIVKVQLWHGVILDVFQSKTTEECIVKILFAKNVYKRQKPEIHEFSMLDIQPATMDDLKAELARYEQEKDDGIEQLLERAKAEQELIFA